MQTLLGHVIGHSMPDFIVAAAGGIPDWQAPARAVQTAWVEAYQTAASELLATWRAADMDRMDAPSYDKLAGWFSPDPVWSSHSAHSLERFVITILVAPISR